MVADWDPTESRAAEFLEAEANEKNHTASLIFISLTLSLLLANYIRYEKPNMAHGLRGFSLQPFQTGQAPSQSDHALAQFFH